MARRIMFIHASSGRYGADLQLYGLATGLDSERYRPLVVLPDPGDLGPLLEDADVETYYTPVAVLRRRLATGRGVGDVAAQLARNRSELGRLARDAGVSVVHTNTSIVLCGQEVAARAGAAHVQHVREIYDGAAGLTGRMLWPVLRRRVARADVLACVSDAVARQFDGCERTFVVQDGLVRVPEPVGRDEARAALELPPDRFVAAVVGRVSDWKGQDVLARALVEPPLAEIGALGLVAGDSAPGQEQHWEGLTALVEELALGDRLRLLGFRDDLGTVLGAADAVVVPSTHPEALPNSALEAAAAGVPLVATATGGTCEIVREGLTGRLVPPGDASALARALRELADDPAQARRLAAAARVDVCERFRLTRMVDEIQARYDRLCA